MKPQGFLMMGVVGAIVLGFAAAPADARQPPFTVKCVVKKNTNVDLIGTDGSECFASSDKMGTATAKASDYAVKLGMIHMPQSTRPDCVIPGERRAAIIRLRRKL